MLVAGEAVELLGDEDHAMVGVRRRGPIGNDAEQILAVPETDRRGLRQRQDANLRRFARVERNRNVVRRWIIRCASDVIRFSVQIRA